ncbi:MAG: response regulator [Campylobacteraceae bacterium]|nr:response regulator [Campylobacteraceae bacterium]
MSSKKIRVAVIDDEQDILDMIEKFLKRSGSFDVTTFINPMNALSAINDSYDVVLLDIMMPQMNGLDVLKELHAKYPTLKVIMMTAYSTLDKVLISFWDNAGGIDTKILPRIFEPFESTKESSGIGIGLNIAHGIVSQNGGKIEAYNYQGGALFEVRFPLMTQEHENGI